mgnify:CR=1 FL=1
MAHFCLFYMYSLLNDGKTSWLWIPLHANLVATSQLVIKRSSLRQIHWPDKLKLVSLIGAPHVILKLYKVYSYIMYIFRITLGVPMVSLLTLNSSMVSLKKEIRDVRALWDIFYTFYFRVEMIFNIRFITHCKGVACHSFTSRQGVWGVQPPRSCTPFFTKNMNS